MPLSNNGFDLFGDAATKAAVSNGVDPAVFAGLIQTESSWNPFASPGTTSAFGLTQLTRGTARAMGVDPRDPIQNLNGGAKYLGGLLKQFGGDYNKALAAYHDGPGSIGLHGGFDYAKKVLSNAQGYLQKGEHLLGLDKAGVGTALNMAVPGLGTVTDGLGITGSSSWFDQFKNWITGSGFFTRLALGFLAFVIIAAGFALMRGQTLSQTIMPKKGV